MDENKEQMYAVMRLQTGVILTSNIKNEEIEMKIDGIDGFIPLFKNFEEAEKQSENGKYRIVPIKINK